MCVCNGCVLVFVCVYMYVCVHSCMYTWHIVLLYNELSVWAYLLTLWLRYCSSWLGGWNGHTFVSHLSLHTDIRRSQNALECIQLAADCSLLYCSTVCIRKKCYQKFCKEYPVPTVTYYWTICRVAEKWQGHHWTKESVKTCKNIQLKRHHFTQQDITVSRTFGG